MPTAGTVSFDDYWEGYNESFSRGGMSVSRLVQVAWNRRYEFMRETVGYSFLGGVLPNNANSTIHRYLPSKHPDATGHPSISSNVYAVSADLDTVVGVPSAAGAGGLIDYGSTGLVRYRVKYEPLTYAIQKDDACSSELERFVTKTWQPTVESLSIPGHLFKWSSDNVKITSPIAKVIPGAEIQYTWWDVPATVIDGQVMLPSQLMTNISDGVGKVNSAAFDANYTSLFAAKTLLALPPRIEATFNAGGFPCYNITYKFIYKPNGWNKLYRVSSGAFAAVTTVAGAGTTEIYATYDFAKFFQTA